ncbi:hypothetical protein [Flavobacterium sp. LB2R40]|uniref:hypothetical protein n=1 Tax=unclassified Flavobacterium TaxID=196869 RepID=UPI003AB0DC10
MKYYLGVTPKHKISVSIPLTGTLGAGFWLYLYLLKKKIKDAAAIPYANHPKTDRNFGNR